MALTRELPSNKAAEKYVISSALTDIKSANFIINEKGATAQDIRSLIQLIKNAVYAQYKIKLEEEIRYLE